MDAIRLRAAVPGDATALGALHVASWRESYVGILPDPVLDALSVDARAALWRAVLDRPDGTAVFVAERGGAIVGFGACGGQRDDTLRTQGFDGEIGALYVRRAHQRAGIGRALIGSMARHLLDAGTAAIALWVLRENRAARAVYDRLGGVRIGERRDASSGAEIVEIAYGWRDPARLTG